MLAEASQSAHDRWRDVEGTPISLFCRVEQVAESMERAALPSQLHQRGQVVGRGLDVLYVRFNDNQLLSVQPRLVRVLDIAPGDC